MRVALKIATLIVCLFAFPLLDYGQVFDNTCPSTQASIVPLRTVNITNGHFNDTTCVDANGNLIFRPLGASLSASDTFTRANGALGSSWNTGIVAPTIQSNAAGGASGQYSIAQWKDTALVFNTQFAQATIAVVGVGEAGPAVFVSNITPPPATNGASYFCGEGTTSITLYRTAGSVTTSLGTSAITGVNGDILRLEITAIGGLTCYRNGVSTLTASDTTYKSGSPGIVLRGAAGTPSTLNNWSGGNLPVSIGTGPNISSATFPNTFLSFGDNTFTGSNIETNWNGIYIENDTKYANIVAMQAAMGTTTPAFGFIPNSPVYNGTDCPATQNNTTFLDYRAGGRVGNGTSSFICTNNVIQINPKTSGLTDSMIRSEMNRTAVDAAGAIVSLYTITHLTNATVTGGVVDGASTEAQINGTFSGTLSALTGNEAVATLTSTGGTVSVASGVLGYCFNTAPSTTVVAECRGLWGRGGGGPSGFLGTRPTNSFGVYASEQLGIGTGRNYAFVGEGQNLVKYSTNQAKGGWDFEDASAVVHPTLFTNSSSNLILQALGATGIFFEDSGGNNLMQISAASIAIIGATTQVFPATTNVVDLGAASNNFRNIFYNNLRTAANCSSSASPAVCGAASAGSFVVAAAATSVTVNTTAVTANSQILIEEDDSLGTKLSVTCNTAASPPGLRISARVAATSFTVTVSAAPVTNPECYSYKIIN